MKILLAVLLFSVVDACPAAERVFFAFDEQSIRWRDNVKLTMVQARKYPGNPVY